MRRSETARKLAAFAAASALLSGCAQTPLGPTVQVMPGPGKSFEAFQTDQLTCRTYAADQVKGQAEASNQRAVGAALLTTVLSAGLGAAVGSGWGAAGAGAGVGAAAGAAGGTAIGADMSASDQYGIQVQYDNAFSQCMYSKGEQVPGFSAPVTASLPPSPSPVAYGGPDPALVRSVQSELVRLNYLQDTPDGVAGGRTRSAIQNFERMNGMPVDGAPSSRLLAKLQGTPTSQSAATASAPANWVAPAMQSGAAPMASPASATGPSGWVAPTRSP